MASTFQNGVMYACFAVLALLACVCMLVGFRQVGMWLRARLCPIALVAFASAAIWLLRSPVGARRRSASRARGVGVLDDLALGLAHGPLHFLNSSLKIVHRHGCMVGRGVPPSRRVGRSPRDRRSRPLPTPRPRPSRSPAARRWR